MSDQFSLSGETGHFCPVDVLKSLGLKGFPNPTIKDKNVSNCKNMKYNCCSTNDLNILNEIWESFEKKTDLNDFYQLYYITEIFKYWEDYQQTAKIVSTSSQYELCKKVGKLVWDQAIDKHMIEKIKYLILKIQKYNKRVKEGFKCFLCDFDSAPFFDTKEKSVFLNNDVCYDIVDNTFEYYNYFNNFVWKYINTLNFLAHCSNVHNTKDAS